MSSSENIKDTRIAQKPPCSIQASQPTTSCDSWQNLTDNIFFFFKWHCFSLQCYGQNPCLINSRQVPYHWAISQPFIFLSQEMYHLTFACCIYYTMCYITKWSLPLKHEDSNSEEHTAGSSKCAVPWWDPGIRGSSKGGAWREALHLAIWDLHWGLTCQSVTVRTLLHLSIIPATQTAEEATAILHS